eukprot:1137613-Pelagomonas_calceolata.AAC.9
MKEHAGIAVFDCANKVAQYQASLKDNDLSGTGIFSAGQVAATPSTILLGWLGKRQDRVHPNLFPYHRGLMI